MKQSIEKTERYSLIKSLLTEEIQLINKATDYLDKIKLSIETNDLEQLQALIRNNEIPLQQIEISEQQRLAMASQYGFEQNKQGFTQCVEHSDDKNNTLMTFLNNLYDAMEALKKATMVNDLLVFKNKTRVQNSLHILTGSKQQDQTYTDKGSKQDSKHSRPLAIA